ncbi:MULTISPECIES: CU044_2847 family protein [unclassified Streptomyces]|uniref:Trypsin-co-occurring domain-containing protein n=1 Tax=Streptomyces sp. NBC_00060 TaxID=2975636 RepID=A0AAU2H857_9ACTN
MVQILTMPLEHGSDVRAVFEIGEDETGGDLELAAGGAGTVARARVSLAEAMDQVRPALSRVVETVRGLGPDEVEIEFGLKAGGESGVIIAKGTAEVNFAVRLVWNRAGA